MTPTKYESIPCDRCGCHAVFIEQYDYHDTPSPLDYAVQIVCFFCVQDENELLHAFGKSRYILAVDMHLTDAQQGDFWNRQECSQNVTRNLNAIIIAIQETS